MRIKERLEDGLNRFLSQRLERKYSGNCYTDLDTLPIFYWSKLNETGELKNLLIKQVKINKPLNIYLQSLFTKLVDEYIKRFGIGERAQEVFDKQKELAKYVVKNIVDGADSYNLACIDIATIELNELKKESGEEQSFFEGKAMLERALKFQIDPFKTSVSEYYSYIVALQKTTVKRSSDE